MLTALIIAALGCLNSSPARAPPALAQRASRRLEETERALASHSGLLLADGNNIRAATGFRFSACEMSDALDAWAARAGYAGRLAVVWDHGESDAFTLPHTASLMSGPHQTADDVIVQACGFLAGACDVIVCTSDQALRGRCRTQFAEAAVADSCVDTLHSVYLLWCLESNADGWRTSAELRARYAQPHQCRAEGTPQRMAQSNELLEKLQRSAHEPTAGDSLLGRLAAWHHQGHDGLGVARQSRRGNPVYSLRRTALVEAEEGRP